MKAQVGTKIQEKDLLIKKKEMYKKLIQEASSNAFNDSKKYDALLQDYRRKEEKVKDWLTKHNCSNINSAADNLSFFTLCPDESKKRTIEKSIKMLERISYIIQGVAAVHLLDAEVTKGPNTFLYLMIMMLGLSAFMVALRHHLFHQQDSDNPSLLFKHLGGFCRPIFWLMCGFSLIVVCIASFLKGAINSNLS